MAKTKRAYSDQEKQQRHHRIVETAQGLLVEKDFNTINMDDVAKQAGIAKGTVYLYFKTKEELFLAIFEEQAAGWFGEVTAKLAAEAGQLAPETIVNILVDSIKDKALFTRLVALKPILLEHNVSFERAHAVNLWLYQSMEGLDRVVAEKLGLAPTTRLQLIPRLYLFVTGLEGMARPSTVAQQVYASEPTLRAVDFEQELRALLLAVMQSSV